jgi:transposase
VFRFQLISAAVDEDLSARARGALVREIAGAWHTDPFGRRVQFSRDTLDRWIRMWRQGGFEALVPSARMTPLRTDTAILVVAEGLKRENPARTAAQVERILIKSQGWSPSQSTLLRLFHRLELPGANGQVAARPVFGRFEAGEPNQMWTGDARHPYGWGAVSPCPVFPGAPPSTLDSGDPSTLIDTNVHDSLDPRPNLFRKDPDWVFPVGRVARYPLMVSGSTSRAH